MPSKLIRNIDQVITYLHTLPHQLLTPDQIEDIVTNLKESAYAGTRTTVDNLCSALPAGMIEKIELINETGRNIIRYKYGDFQDLEILASFSQQGYFSHATALALRGVTDTLSESIFFTTEQIDKREQSSPPLLQQAIDKAFAQPARLSNNRYTWRSYTAYLLRKKVSRPFIGVANMPGTNYACTDLERTLLDIVVRPEYAGGPQEVLSAFIQARDRLDCSRLRQHLQAFAFQYPYHQSIGFYLERAKYPQYDWEPFAILPKPYDFYLSHELSAPAYHEGWRIFYPTALITTTT